MPLRQSQFIHAGLAKVYFGGSSNSIPVSLEGKCRRRLDMIENATRPDDPDLPGVGYKLVGKIHSLDVNGTYRISYEWRNGQAADIDYG
jgi:plasmid maintenance system killer protein